MDNLNSIPSTASQMTPQEQEVMKKYFTDVPPENTKTDRIKKIIIIALIYVVLNNPLVDTLGEKIEFIDKNPVVVWAAKTLAFVAIAGYLIYTM